MVTASQDPSVLSPARYRAISFWAVLSVVCGAATVVMFFGWWGGLAPLAAIYFGWKALQQIDRLPEEYTGRRVAQVGIGLAVGLGALFSGGLILGLNEVPYGYKVLDYADLEPNDKSQIASAAAIEMSDKKTRVYARGYMLSGRRQVQLTEFSIVRTSDQCSFQQGINRPVDMIRIELTGDHTIDYTTHQIGVGGIFHVDESCPNGTPYSIQGDYIYK
jgi:hypothetical protein